MKTELLAPAGNMERLKTAVKFGADAVYLGGKKLGLRAFSDNFDSDELTLAVEFCHENNVKVYFTLNAYLDQKDIDGLDDYLKSISKSGVDAVLVSDLGALNIIKEKYPELEVHISTQANIFNSEAVKFLAKAGASRIVLARECTLDDIKRIKDAVGDSCELEAFVHGAMCVAYSGRCLLSSIMTGRDGNKGACAQMCRRNFELRERDEDGELYPIEEDDEGTYILNSRDLNMIEHIPELINAGIDSLKIEGRMKTIFYLATVTNTYRSAIDDFYAGKSFNNELVDELNKIRHRPYSTGFYFADGIHKNEPRESQLENANPQTHEFIAIVLESSDENGKALIEQRNKFYVGDILEVITPGVIGKNVVVSEICDLNGGEMLEAPHPMQKLYISNCAGLVVGDILRRKMAVPLK